MKHRNLFFTLHKIKTRSLHASRKQDEILLLRSFVVLARTLTVLKRTVVIFRSVSFNLPVVTTIFSGIPVK